MILETPRLILRPFAADDLYRMSELMANKDFMRFSMGPMTQEQTKSFLNKVIGWDRDGMPSQFAMIVRSSETLAGYCGFFHHEVDSKMEIEIGYRLDSGCWNRGLAGEAARTVRDHGSRPKTRLRHLFDSSRRSPIAPSGGKKWNDSGKKDDL